MKRSEIKAKFDQIVDFSGVEKFLDTPVKHYSSGMKVRLAFSVAAHLEPEILIVDEVLAVGDAEFQKKCLGKMNEVSKTEGRTVLFVSHNMGAVQSLCTRGIVIKQGMVIRNDSIERAVLEYIRVTSSKNDKSIECRNDRLGGDKFRFKGVKFFDISSNLEIDIVVSGQSINIIINSESKLPKRENLVLSIGFFTVEGVFLFACKSDVIGVNLKSSNSEHVCSINKFPLKRGVYKYNLAAYYDGEMVDHLVNAGELIVEDGDFYGTGKLPATSKSGGVLIEFNWRNG
jgi:lipopolysaccharide transport system ATP-binding protein